MDSHRLQSLILAIILAGVCAAVREIIKQLFIRKNKIK